MIILIIVTRFWPIGFNLILRGLKCKIKISETYFDEKYNLLACMETRDYNVFLSFYSYFQDNYYLRDNS